MLERTRAMFGKLLWWRKKKERLPSSIDELMKQAGKQMRANADDERESARHKFWKNWRELQGTQASHRKSGYVGKRSEVFRWLYAKLLNGDSDEWVSHESGKDDDLYDTIVLTRLVEWLSFYWGGAATLVASMVGLSTGWFGWWLLIWPTIHILIPGIAWWKELRALKTAPRDSKEHVETRVGTIIRYIENHVERMREQAIGSGSRAHMWRTRLDRVRRNFEHQMGYWEERKNQHPDSSLPDTMMANITAKLVNVMECQQSLERRTAELNALFGKCMARIPHVSERLKDRAMVAEFLECEAELANIGKGIEVLTAETIAMLAGEINTINHAIEGGTTLALSLPVPDVPDREFALAMGQLVSDESHVLDQIHHLELQLESVEA